ncbi:thiamine phosphate synthase [Rhodospirillales bacterium]|nr:thiamine phosphate synthase [Rhodospirillales bacterium]
MERTISNIALRLNFGADATHLPPLVLFSDEERQPEPLSSIALLPPGSAVLFRHYSFPARRRLALALRTLCDTRALFFIVSNDVDLALEVAADGLHLPEYCLKGADRDIHKWRQFGEGFLTAAIHSPQALINADRLNVDAAFLSPVFISASHPNKKPLGLMRFIKICNSTQLPIYALGGINDISAKRLVGSGAAGIGVVGAMID